MSTSTQETLRIATPEGVSLELPLAGVGSRFLALLGDVAVQLGTLFVLGFASGAANIDGPLPKALVVVAGFVLFFVYPVAFEVAGGGRTLGKRWCGLRVVNDDGSPVTFRSSALRNLVRLVDYLPAFYLIGAITIFATSKNQRLGDLAGGTIVVRDPARRAAALALAPIPFEETEPAELPAWDVSGLSSNELAALRRFLERRSALDAVPRNLLARDLADRLRPSVGGVGSDLAPERFLELIAALRHIRT